MDTLLKVSNLSIFHDGEKVIDDVNLEFKEGEFVCFVGYPFLTGTIFLRSLIFLNEDVSRKYKTVGDIMYRGKIVTRSKAKFLRTKVSYLGNEILSTMDEFSIRELLILMIGRENMNDGFGFELSSILDELHILSNLPDGMNSRLRKLERDTKILFFLSLSILRNSDVIIFDGVLDDLSEKNFENMVGFLEKMKNKTFVVSTKNPRRFMGLSDRVVMMENGKVIFDGDPKQIIMNWGRSRWKFSQSP
ncbi:MAG TPA: hypothetical protein ENG58_05130 [Thermotogales bacterium]|nr:hypothetical protein [Thermotogales bacterium]